MTRSDLSIRLVLILATAIGIHGQTPREATLTLKSDFEDGQSDREFRVDYPGIVGSDSAMIKIFKAGDTKPQVDYTLPTNAKQPQILHFELTKDQAPAGSLYEVQVCLPDGETCSDKRPALGKIMDDAQKPYLTCTRAEEKDETELDKLLLNKKAELHKVQIRAGGKFVDGEACEGLPVGSQLKMKTNPTYKQVGNKYLFYTAVWYDGKPLAELFKKISENGYCSRKYIFWASAHVVHKATKEVRLRYRGTHTVTEKLAQEFILKSGGPDFPVEFARYDEKKLPAGKYYVSVSFCASEKDVINSSICSEAVYADLEIPESN